MTKIVRSFGSWDGENTKTCFASYQGPIFLSLSPYSVITPSYLNSLFCVCHCLSVPFSNWIFRTLYLLQWLSCYFTFVSAPYLGTCLSLCVSFCPSTSFLLVVLCFWISHFNSNNPFNSYILVILIYFLISVPLFRSFLFCSFVQFESLLFILSHSNHCDQIWRNFTTLVRRFNTLAIKKGSFTIWQHLELTLTYIIWFWANVQCCKLPNIEPINWSSGHTDSNQPTSLSPKFTILDIRRPFISPNLVMNSKERIFSLVFAASRLHCLFGFSKKRFKTLQLKGFNGIALNVRHCKNVCLNSNA